MFQDDKINKIYGGIIEYPLYTSYMDKGKLQSCLMMFSTIEIVDDKNRNKGVNIQLKSFPLKIHYGMDNLNKEKGNTFVLISPKISFAKMFKNANIDIRDLANREAVAEVDFIIHSQKLYEIKRFEIKKIKDKLKED